MGYREEEIPRWGSVQVMWKSHATRKVYLKSETTTCDVGLIHNIMTHSALHGPDFNPKSKYVPIKILN